MRILEQSARIMDELDALTPEQRIEKCGRICYKSEDKITDNSAEGFCKKMLEHGHNSVMEMMTITLFVKEEKGEALGENFGICDPKYFHIDLHGYSGVITGSVRAFREVYFSGNFNILGPFPYIAKFLSDTYPNLFGDLDSVFGSGSTFSVRLLKDWELDDAPYGARLKHKHVAVKFITNRVVTHELVRHRPVSYLQESQRFCNYSTGGDGVAFIAPTGITQGSYEWLEWAMQMESAEQAYMKLSETLAPQIARTVLPNSCKTEIIAYTNLKEWQHIFNLRTSRAADPAMREVMVPLYEEFKERGWL